MSSKCILLGQWKAYHSKEETLPILKKMAEDLRADEEELYLALPFNFLKLAHEQLSEYEVVFGASGMNSVEEDSFTAECAGNMLKDAGAAFVVLGDFRARHNFKESNQSIRNKLVRALEDGLKPVLCISASKKEDESGQTQEILRQQLQECLDGIAKKDMKQLILVYQSASDPFHRARIAPDIVQNAKEMCLELFKEIAGKRAKVPFLCGLPSTIRGLRRLFSETDVDGFFFGKASTYPATIQRAMEAVVEQVDDLEETPQKRTRRRKSKKEKPEEAIKESSEEAESVEDEEDSKDVEGSAEEVAAASTGVTGETEEIEVDKSDLPETISRSGKTFEGDSELDLEGSDEAVEMGPLETEEAAEVEQDQEAEEIEEKEDEFKYRTVDKMSDFIS